MSSIVLNLSGTYQGDTENSSLTSSSVTEQVGSNYFNATQVVGTSSEALLLGDLANVGGGLIIRNNDADNYVEVDAITSFDAFPQKILPGQAVRLAPQTISLFVKANTASVNVSVWATEA